jgi:nucleotide-binding universal stress UspA family protein
MLYGIRTIVAGISQPEDDAVLVPAQELATRCGAFLHLVHAPEVPDMVWNASRAHVRTGPDDDRVAYHPVHGPPGPAIVALAKAVSADLIIVGASRGNRFSAALFGSTARAVTREAEAPVLVLRGHAPQQVSRVLIATDLSPLSATAFEVGLDIVEALFPGDPALRALDVAFDDPSLAPPLRGTMFDDLAADELNTFLRARRERKSAIEPKLRFGDPVKEITEEAGGWRADLVVLGTQGRTGAARVLIGSTADAVTAKVECSVLLVSRKVAGRVTLPVPAPETTVSPSH